MRCGSVYLVAKDFEKSVLFYEKILDRKVSRTNGSRFAVFNMQGLNLCLMNGHFDSQHKNEVITKGDYFEIYDDMDAIAESKNARKVFINLVVDDLRNEYHRIRSLGIAKKLTPIRFMEYVSPYWYFSFMDPDDNPIEITGSYEE